MTRPATTAELAITFFYYRDLEEAIRFYRDILGFELVIDQGWSKIFRICPGAHVGLVDEAKGMNKWTAEKPVQLCIRVGDVDQWHQYATSVGVENLSAMFDNDKLGIRAFVFTDTEGYQIEIQSATREDA